MTSVQSDVKEAVERVTAEMEDAARYESLSVAVTIADLRTLLAALSSQAEVMEAMAEEMRRARALLMERIHGNPARSPGHNARLAIESALDQYRSLNGDA